VESVYVQVVDTQQHIQDTNLAIKENVQNVEKQ